MINTEILQFNNTQIKHPLMLLTQPIYHYSKWIFEVYIATVFYVTKQQTERKKKGTKREKMKEKR